MIEIKCSAAEKERLMEALNMNDAPCPFVGLCMELPYYKTGISHRECIEHNIKWTITDAKPEEKPEEKSVAVDITRKRFMEVASEVAVDYYKPYSNYENIHEFIMSSGYMALVAHRLFEEDK